MEVLRVPTGVWVADGDSPTLWRMPPLRGCQELLPPLDCFFWKWQTSLGRVASEAGLTPLSFLLFPVLAPQFIAGCFLSGACRQMVFINDICPLSQLFWRRMGLNWPAPCTTCLMSSLFLLLDRSLARLHHLSRSGFCQACLGGREAALMVLRVLDAHKALGGPAV